MSRTQHNKYPKVQYNTELIRACPRNRSVVAPAGVPKHRSERPLTHSSVLGSHTIICLSELITYLNHILCHDILFFMFMFMFQFIIIFHSIFIFHERIYTYCISYIFLVSCLLHMEFHILVRYDTYVFTPHSCFLVPL